MRIKLFGAGSKSMRSEQPDSVTFYGELKTGRPVQASRVKPFRRHADARPKATRPRAGLENTSSFDAVWEEA